MGGIIICDPEMPPVQIWIYWLILSLEKFFYFKNIYHSKGVNYITIKERIGYFILIFGLVIFLFATSLILFLFSQNDLSIYLHEDANIYITIDIIIQYISRIIIFIGIFIIFYKNKNLSERQQGLIFIILCFLSIAITYSIMRLHYLSIMLESNYASEFDTLIHDTNFYTNFIFIFCLITILFILNLKNKCNRTIFLFSISSSIGVYLLYIIFRIQFIFPFIFCLLLLCSIITYINFRNINSPQKPNKK